VELGRLDEAADATHKAIGLHAEEVRKDPTDRSGLVQQARSLIDLVLKLVDREQPGEAAESLIAGAISIGRQLVAGFSDEPSRHDLLNALLRLQGRHLDQTGGDRDRKAPPTDLQPQY
jgi:hypothetical protein